MNLISLLCAIQVVWGENWDFYHELSAETLQPPNSLREDSYFGFSTTYDRYNMRMMISAPRENNIGEVYECDLNTINDKSCSRLSRNISREAESYTHDYWFGATIKAGPTYVLACTPRYARFPGDCTIAGTYGRCYRRRENETFFSYPIFPRAITSKDCENLEKKMDSLGWSLDIGKEDSVIIGSPAMFQDTGMAAVLPSKKRLVKRIDKVESNIYNFGYGVAVGYFMAENKVSYAVSTTYGNFGSGRVYFYIPTENNGFNKPIQLNKGLDENVVGSMFGAVLCTANINDLGKGDDLLVGAPTYALKTGYNTGAVYVYGYKKIGTPPEFRSKIVGQKDGSMFGSAIISVGDLNGDKKDEIAIGAPFEGDGAVYLYSGAAIYSGKTLTWMQRITPTEKDQPSFGYSLAALQDYDDNGCNELAVSAPYKNKVKVYKCLAAVTITKIYAKFPNVTNRVISRQTDFVFQVCMNVEYPEKPKNIIAELSTDVRMDHMYAKLKNLNARNVYTFSTQLQSKKPTYCENIDFVLPLDKDYSTEIGYEISTKLQNSPRNMTHVTGGHAILSDYSKLTYSGAFWAGECSGIGECISNLSLTITSEIKEKPFITGSRDNGVFHVKVLNTGEVAYDPCIQLSVTGGSLHKIPMYCSRDDVLDETWLCKTMKPVRTDPWEIKDITMDLRGLTNQDEEIALKLKLFERCAVRNNGKTYEYSIPLRSNSDGVYIRGITDVGDVNIVEDEVLFSKHFEQIYTIYNKGPTNFRHLTSNITVKMTDFITFSDTPVSIHIDGTSQSKGIHKICTIDSNDFKMTAICQIEKLYKDSFVKIKISMDTNPDTLTYDVLKQQKVAVNSTLAVYFNKDESKSLQMTMSTPIQLREGSVDLWMLIVAGLVGILLIIVIAVILYKSGFLQRKKKKKLNSLKESVKRQTIRRSMMTQPATGDRNQILENMEMSEDLDISDDNPPERSRGPVTNLKI